MCVCMQIYDFKLYVQSTLHVLSINRRDKVDRNDNKLHVDDCNKSEVDKAVR